MEHLRHALPWGLVAEPEGDDGPEMRFLVAPWMPRDMDVVNHEWASSAAMGPRVDWVDEGGRRVQRVHTVHQARVNPDDPAQTHPAVKINYRPWKSPSSRNMGDTGS